MKKLNLMNQNYHVIKKQKRKPFYKTYTYENPKTNFKLNPLVNINSLLDKVFQKKKEEEPDNQEIDYSLEDTEIHILSEDVTKLINVYQQIYKNDKNASGFGDFIRGSYFLMQYCETYNIDCDIIINHPIRKYFEYTTVEYRNLNNINHLNIEFFEKNRINDFPVENSFIKFLNHSEKYLGTCFIHTYSYPNKEITHEHMLKMQHYLKPTKEITDCVDTVCRNLNLTTFSVIHIRAGDKYLIEDSAMDLKLLKKVVTHIQFVNRSNNTFLLLSDSYKLKFLIMKIYPKLKIYFNEITHFGEGVLLDDAKIKNTIIDFFLMSKSQKIYSLSVYQHGSGFSEWCAKTYGIPYYNNIIV